MPISLKQEKLAKWQKDNFPDDRLESMSRPDLVALVKKLQCALGIAEKAGEICHHVLKGSQGIRGGTNGINKAEVADGVADTLIYGIQLLSALEVDAEGEIKAVIERVLKRDWQKNPTGNGGGNMVQNVACSCQDDHGSYEDSEGFSRCQLCCLKLSGLAG